MKVIVKIYKKHFNLTYAACLLGKRYKKKRMFMQPSETLKKLSTGYARTYLMGSSSTTFSKSVSNGSKWFTKTQRAYDAASTIGGVFDQSRSASRLSFLPIADHHSDKHYYPSHLKSSYWNLLCADDIFSAASTRKGLEDEDDDIAIKKSKGCQRASQHAVVISAEVLLD